MSLDGGLGFIDVLAARPAGTEGIYLQVLWVNTDLDLIGPVSYTHLLGADMDDASLIQSAPHIIADIWDLTGDLLRAQLGITGFGLIFLDVDGGEQVVPHQLLDVYKRQGMMFSIACSKASSGSLPVFSFTMSNAP